MTCEFSDIFENHLEKRGNDLDDLTVFLSDISFEFYEY